MSWSLIEIPAPPGTDAAVMACVSPKMCDGIVSEGCETLFDKNATDPAQQWVEMIGSVNHQYTNLKGGPLLCSTVMIIDDKSVPNAVKLTKCDPSSTLQKFTKI